LLINARVGGTAASNGRARQVTPSNPSIARRVNSRWIISISSRISEFRKSSTICKVLNQR
jgi:hypothetical protein